MIYKTISSRGGFTEQVDKLHSILADAPALIHPRALRSRTDLAEEMEKDVGPTKVGGPITPPVSLPGREGRGSWFGSSYRKTSLYRCGLEMLQAWYYFTF